MALRYEHQGSAAATTLSTSVTAVSTTINIAASTGWPTGSVDPFWVTIDRGNASEEKVLVLSRTGTALTVTTRGADGTTASSHASGASIEHTISATEVDDANALAAQVTTLGGTVATTSAAQTFTNKTLTAPTVTDITGAARGTLNYAQITADQGSITTEADITSLSVAVTVGAGRRIRITAFTGSVKSTVANDYIALTIKEGGTQLTTGTVSPPNGTNGLTATVSVVLTPSTGAHTYKVACARVVGSGTVTFGATATNPAYILVEDIGV